MDRTTLPLVSLIIPVYNVDRYIDACLDSVSRQSYPNLEVIIVDDGSTDGSGKRCDAWCAVNKIGNVYHIANSGPAAARNFGIDHCHGDFIAFVDSDDVIGPEYVNCMMSMLKADPDVDVAITSFLRGTSHDDVVWVDWEVEVTSSGEEALRVMLYQIDNVDSAVSCKLIQANLLENLRFKDGILYEDLDFWSRLFTICKKVVRSDAANYFYRINPTGLTGKNNFNLRRLDVLAVTEDIYARSEGQPWFMAARDRLFSANCNMYALLCANGFKHTVYADECWQAIKKLRMGSLLDPHTRIKSKAGAISSYLGKRLFGIISSFTI